MPSHFSQGPTVCNPMDYLLPYWNGLPCPPPGDLPHPGIKLISLTSPPWADRFFTPSASWEALLYAIMYSVYNICIMYSVYTKGFPRSSDGEESACNTGDLGSIPGLGRSPGGGHGHPLLYSCLENPYGQRSQAGYSPCGHKESDTTELLSTQHIYTM